MNNFRGFTTGGRCFAEIMFEFESEPNPNPEAM